MKWSNDKEFQVLSLSGGGVRGLYTISVLAEIETLLSQAHGEEDYWIGQHFDLICGTSIGGILALGLASGKTARELKLKFDESRKKIFPPPWWKRLQNIKPAFGAKYHPKGLKEVLSEIFQDKTLGDLQTRVLIPTVNYTKGAVQVFKTPHHPDLSSDWRRKCMEVALATSAAPTYFPIHSMNDCWYVDGGLAANSPALMGFHEASHFLKKDKIRIMLVGTLGSRKSADQSKSKNPGYLGGWGLGKDLIDLTLSVNEGLHNQIVKHLVPEGHLLLVDDTPSNDQSRIIDLDNSSDASAQTLRGLATEKAKTLMADDSLKPILKHKAEPPRFYHGPKKVTPTEGATA